MADIKGKGRKKPQKLSVLHRPKDMSTEQWQRALRRQAAETETFSVRPIRHRGGLFLVRNLESDRALSSLITGNTHIK